MQPGQVDAALNAKTSEVITQFHQRHRSAQFREFLDLIETRVPRRLDVHIIMDNYSPHNAHIAMAHNIDHDFQKHDYHQRYQGGAEDPHRSYRSDCQAKNDEQTEDDEPL